jgi:hypothetical protein
MEVCGKAVSIKTLMVTPCILTNFLLSPSYFSLSSGVLVFESAHFGGKSSKRNGSEAADIGHLISDV